MRLALLALASLAPLLVVAPRARAQDVDAGVPAPDAAVVADVDAGPAAPPTQPAALPRVLVIDASPYGVDPLVGVLVSRTLRQTAATLGYDVLSPEESVAVAQQLPMPYPPSAADLWRASWLAHAERGVFARVWAEHGAYVVEVVVASTDGGGPFTARATAPDTTLLGVVADLLRATLPPPGVRTAPLPAPEQIVSAGQPPGTAAPPAAAPRRRVHTGQARRWAFVGILDGAFGLSQDFFFNLLLGVRLDFRITTDIRVGVGVLAAALRGKVGVAGNVLMLAQLEDRLRIASDSDIRVPLRLAVGYLPFNGPVVRLAAGLEIPFERRWELVLDILAVDFWVLPDHTVVSLDLATELGYRF